MKIFFAFILILGLLVLLSLALSNAFGCSSPGASPPGDSGSGADPPGDSGSGDDGASDSGGPGVGASSAGSADSGDVPNDYLFEYDPADSYIEHFHGRNLFFDFIGLGKWWDKEKKHDGRWK